MVYNTITSGIVGIFAFLDWCVYSLIGAVMEGLYNISETKILTDGPISDITDRLYIILGIFMLFKMAITMLKGIVNPDSINDKQAGMQKIIVRVITVLVLLLMVPTIFQFAYRVQGHALQALPQIILGPNESTNLSVGNSVASTVLASFITTNDECESTADINIDLSEPGSFVSDVSSRCTSNNDDDGNKIFQYNYTFIVSTVVGIILVVLIVLVSLDVAIRLIKLSILQIIAPIPIMTYIDPKSSKDGSFSNWSKECLNTYLSLFIQLGVIYFIVYLLQKIIESIGDGLQGEVGSLIDFGAGASTTGAKSWVIIFIVIAAFFFMKQAPKYIMKVLGIKGGASLGVGLSAGLAGVGALTNKGGLAGAGAAMLSSINDGVDANVDGKSAFEKGGFKRGSEIAAQFNGGEKPVPLMDKLTNALRRKQAAAYGVTDDTLDAAKAARDTANSRFSLAESKLEEAIQNGTDVQWGAETYSVDDFRNMVYNGKDSFQAQAKKTASRYDEMNAFGKTMGVEKSNETYVDKYRSKPNDYININPTSYAAPPDSVRRQQTERLVDSRNTQNNYVPPVIGDDPNERGD